MPIQFGAFELDEQNYELRRHGNRVPVPRRVFDTIAFLATNADRVVTKQELIDGPWRGQAVTDAALARAIMRCRETLGDDAGNPTLITTVRGRGFRFQAPMPVARSQPMEPGRPFYGRLRESAALEDAVASARAGHGGLFLVSGEPGIGKTALVEQFARQVQSRVPVFWGRAWEAGGAPSFWPWSEALRAFCDLRSRSSLQELLKGISADVARLVPSVIETAAADIDSELEETGEARFRVFDSISTFLQRAAAAQPLALILEDLHAADEPTLSLLSFIAPVLVRSRLLVVGTCRTPDYQDRETLRTLVERTTPSLHTSLEGLAQHELAGWIADKITEKEVAGVAADLHRLTSGHPILVQEVLRDIKPGCALAATNELLLRSPPSVPHSLAAAVLARLARLPAGTRTLLDRAAVLGREFSLVAAGAIVNESNRDSLMAIEPALHVGLVERVQNPLGSFRFSHDLVRRTIYDELSTEARLQLHHEIGTSLARFSPNLRLFEIANHLLIAAPVADVDLVVNWALRAVAQANRQVAHEHAAGYAARALVALDARGDANLRRGDVLLALAGAQRFSGQLAAADATLRECCDWSLEQDRHECLVSAIVSRLDLLRERATVVLDFQEQVNTARDLIVEPKPVRAQILAASAVANFFGNTAEETRRTFEEAFRLARESGDPYALMTVNTACLVANRRGSSTHETLLATEELMAAARKTRRLDRLMEALVMRAGCFLEQGQGTEFRAAQSEHTRIAHALRYRIELWHSTQMDHVSALLDGNFEHAEDRAREALRLGAPQLGPAALGVFGAQLLSLAVEKPRADARCAVSEALNIGREFLAVAPDYPAWTIGTAFAEMELGDRAAAAEVVRIFTGDRLGVVASDANRSLCFVYLALMAARLDDLPAAERLRRELAPLRGSHAANYVTYLGPLNYFSGRLCMTLGRLEQAIECFEAALSDSVRIGSQPWRVWSAFALSQALRLEASPATLHRRSELLESSETQARKLGMGRFLETLAEAQKGAAPGSHPF